MLARVALFAALLASCGVPGDGEYFGRTDLAEAGHLRWCNQGEPDFLDPARSQSTVAMPLVYALFDGLTIYDPAGLPAPSLATHWDTSADLRTWTFHLRDDAVWSNGRAVTAWDIAYGTIRTVHPLTASPNADNIAPIQNVIPYLERKVYRLRADAGPYKVGDIVELVDPPNDIPDLAARTSSRPLPLRDLWGTAPAYATVPAGTDVQLVMMSDTAVSWPSPDGKPWAYVFWQRDVEGVFGWVPAAALDGEPHAGAKLTVRRVPAKRGGADGDAPAVAVTGAQLAYTPDVVGIRVGDAHTITITCADPTPYLLAETDNRAMRGSPIEAVSRHPVAWTRPENIVSNGPLRLDAWIERDRLELSRSPTYWNQGDIKLDRLTAFSMDDQAANTNFYFTGGCDAQASNDVPSTYLPILNGERGPPYKDFDISPYLGVYFLWVNTEKLPNRHLRRALSLAIDRTAIPKFTHGGEIPSAQLTPGTPIAKLSPADLAACGVPATTKGTALVMQTGALCYVPPPGLDYDLAAARAEIALARDEGGVPAKLHYIYNAGSEAHKQIAEYAQAAWRAIGLDVDLEAQEWNAMLEATRKGDFEIARLGNIGTFADTESEFLPLFTCGNPDNRGRYCSKDYERLLGEAHAITDRRARNAKLAQAEQVMIEDAPVIPIYAYTQKHLIKPYVKDYPINLIDQPGLWRVSIDTAWHR